MRTLIASILLLASPLALSDHNSQQPGGFCNGWHDSKCHTSDNRQHSSRSGDYADSGFTISFSSQGNRQFRTYSGNRAGSHGHKNHQGGYRQKVCNNSNHSHGHHDNHSHNSNHNYNHNYNPNYNHHQATDPRQAWRGTFSLNKKPLYVNYGSLNW